jgi:hypothetical protein
MTELHLDLADDRRAFKPGESVEGRVSWNVDGATSAEVRLFWYTRGKGTEDVGLVDTVAFPNPQATDQRTFRFTLPEAPYSFSGKLISILWAIELIVEPGSSVERREIVVSPSGREVVVAHESA